MPTIRQKKAFKEVLNGSTISGAMVKAGYSPTTASTTGKLTNTKGWEELLQKHLPDRVLTKKHRELLEKREVVLTSKRSETGEKVFEVLDQPETQAVSKALEMAYKLKGRYSDSPLIQVNIANILNKVEAD